MMALRILFSTTIDESTVTSVSSDQNHLRSEEWIYFWMRLHLFSLRYVFIVIINGYWLYLN